MRYFLFASLLFVSTMSYADLQSADITTNHAAHWLDLNHMRLKSHPDTKNVELMVFAASTDASAEKTEQVSSFKLKSIPSNKALSAKFPHLAEFSSFYINVDTSQAKQLVKKRLSLVQKDQNGKPLVHSMLQTGALLDSLFADRISSEQSFGAVLSEQQVDFTLWAPTASNVHVLLYDKNKRAIATASLAMQEDTDTGIWRATYQAQQADIYYQYQIDTYHYASDSFESLVTTDPYSLSLSVNSQYSHVVDLNSAHTKPQDWDTHVVPALPQPEDQILYEVHIRDFSSADGKLADEANRGKYAAFLETESAGISHLKKLKQAGLNTIHLLPTYDIATVNEDPNQRIALQDELTKICRIKPAFSACKNSDKALKLVDLLQQYQPSSPQQQALIEEIRQLDDYNWGYDPFHYTVPEGSYAKEPEGTARILAFRQMVQRLHQMGFRVVMDVVYNHTYAAGLAEKSVLDKVVPGYYHRRNPISGAVEQSTCCDNTATERSMMARLMTDSLVVWARDYKIDGFRFDLMGHQPKSAMLDAREAVRKVDPDTYFYGEGWNFGEVANNSQFIQATQLELAGTEIGTFTDRLRDAVRGGASFSSGGDYRKAQGLGNGLFTMPNELQPKDRQLQHFLLLADQARVGLAGNLADFPLADFNDNAIVGKQVDYNGSPTGYALDPADTVNYVSKHDNQTLWDNNQYRTAFSATAEQRVRMQLLALAFPIYSQGIPFIHMGSELLRSKGFLRDSYDYGDWFNAVDFSMQSNNYNTGLPPAVKDQQNWPLVERVRDKHAGKDQVSPELIAFARDSFLDMLSIRASSPLFKLRSAAQINETVRFLNTGSQQKRGLIAMQITDKFELDDNWQSLLIVFNLTPQHQSLQLKETANYQLHPILEKGNDPAQQQANWKNGRVTLPGLTASVFVN